MKKMYLIGALACSAMLTGCLDYETKEVTIEVKHLLNGAEPYEQSKADNYAGKAPSLEENVEIEKNNLIKKIFD